MPMDDSEKKELVKKIMEQRKAMWKGEVVTDQKSKQSVPPSQQNITDVVPTASMPVSDIPVIISKDDYTDFDNTDNAELTEHKPKFSMKAEFYKGKELGLRVIFTVISILVAALLLGIVIGYLITTLDFSKTL
jgi:hypothetical protein